MIAGVVAIVGGVIGLGAAAGWFTTRLLDQQAVQDGVQQILTDHYDMDVSTVSCPPAPEVKVHNTFTCTVGLSSGESVTVRVVVVSEDGTYTVGRP